ncbi:hypothetical protein D3C78_828630 [compost metagenome]
MRCVIEQDQVLDPDGRALMRNAVHQVAHIAGLGGGQLRVIHTARPTEHHADVAVSQVGDEPRRIEVADIRPDLEQQGFGLAVILGVLAVVGQSEVVQGDRNDFAGRIQHGHAALAELGNVLFLENQVPGVDRRLRAQQCRDLVGVVAHAGGAPQVGRGETITRVVALHLGQDLGVQVRQVRQLAAIQLLEHPGLDQVGQQFAAGDHHVITAAPGHELALHHIAIIEHVIDRGDAGFLLEVFRGIRCDVVVPVVNRDAGFGGAGAGHSQAEQSGRGQLHATQRFHRKTPERQHDHRPVRGRCLLKVKDKASATIGAGRRCSGDQQFAAPIGVVDLLAGQRQSPVLEVVIVLARGVQRRKIQLDDVPAFLAPGFEQQPPRRIDH